MGQQEFPWALAEAIQYLLLFLLLLAVVVAVITLRQEMQEALAAVEEATLTIFREEPELLVKVMQEVQGLVIQQATVEAAAVVRELLDQTLLMEAVKVAVAALHFQYLEIAQL